MNNNYNDIINLKHHTSLKHPRMSIDARSAQFAPFAALTGYNEKIKEESRTTNKKIMLSEEAKTIIDSQLQLINDNIKEKPTIKLTYFIKDKNKPGGIYHTITDNVKKIDNIYKILYLVNNKINIDDILDIEILK